MALSKVLSAFGKLGVVALVALAFAFGLLLTVYLSLRSPDIKVPEVVNKTYVDGETELAKAGFDIRKRAERYKPDVPPGVILDQSPRPGEVIKAGQTVAVVVSRAPKEGERPPDEAVAEERREERGTEAIVENKNTNSRRPRNTNRNANANSNGATNSNAATNTGGDNSNGAPRNTAGPPNSNAAGPRNTNANRANTNASRPRSNTNSAGPRNTGPARPSNANRRPGA